MSRIDNTGWEIFDSYDHHRTWGYSRRKHHGTGWEIQHIKGRTECEYGPSGAFLESIENSYFIPDPTPKREE